MRMRKLPLNHLAKEFKKLSGKHSPAINRPKEILNPEESPINFLQEN